MPHLCLVRLDLNTGRPKSKAKPPFFLVFRQGHCQSRPHAPLAGGPPACFGCANARRGTKIGTPSRWASPKRTGCPRAGLCQWPGVFRPGGLLRDWDSVSGWRWKAEPDAAMLDRTLVALQEQRNLSIGAETQQLLIRGCPRPPHSRNLYKLAFPCALACFHRALANAASRALPAALSFRFGFWAALAATFAPLIFAHLARAAAAIRARPAALIFRFRGAAGAAGAPRLCSNCFCSRWIFS